MYIRWLDILWWEIKFAFLQEWRLFTFNPFRVMPSTSRQPVSREVANDWTWRWEFQDQWFGIVFNAGTKDNPEWVCMR